MAKAKLSLVPNPLFSVDVGIPIPGVKEPTPVAFEFKHKGKTALNAFRETVDFSADGITVAHVREMASSWGIEDEFSDENIGKLLEEFPGSGLAIYARFMGELQDAKLGNFGR